MERKDGFSEGLAREYPSLNLNLNPIFFLHDLYTEWGENPDPRSTTTGPMGATEMEPSAGPGLLDL